MSIQAWARRVSGVLENLADPFEIPIKEPSPKIRQYLFDLAWPMRRVLALGLFFAIIAAIIEVWLIGYAGRLVDSLAETGKVDFWSEHGGTLVFVAVLMLVLRPISHFAREGMNDLGLQSNMSALARWRAFVHVSRQPVGWFQDDLSGRTASRVMEVGSSATTVIYNVLNTLVYVTIYMFGILYLMWSTDPRLALPILFWMGLYVWLTRAVIPRLEAVVERFQNARSGLFGTIVDTFSNMDTVAIFSDRNADQMRVREQFESLRQFSFAERRIEVALNIAITVLEGVMMIGLVGYGIVLWQQGVASIGLVAAALALSFKITSMAEWLLDAIASVFSSIGEMREALKTVAQPLAITDAIDATSLRVDGGAISIKGLQHHYGKTEGGLESISLDIAPGEKVGLVGPSGAGKSTLVNLLLRFFERESGVIAIDGQDIRDVTQASLHGAIGMVAQQASLLNRSVRENITLGRDLPEAAVIAAVKQAEALEFVEGLQDSAGRTGLDAHVGERGIKLSGGQRQRIALARVILKDAPILVLDEATSALDSSIEAALLATLYEVMLGKTVIAIAHRLSTIAQMDRIIVLDQGRIAETGSHAELLQADGLYARLWRHQSGGFIGAAAE